MNVRPGAVVAARSLIGQFGRREVQAGQDQLGLSADDLGPAEWNESGDQADFRRRASHFVPRNPNAVGVAQIRFAVVLGEPFRGEDEFPGGPIVARPPVLFVEGVDDQCSLNLGRGAFLLVVEHDPAAESAGGSPAGAVMDRILPEDDHVTRRLGVVLAVVDPGDGASQIELGAAHQRRQTGRE